MILDKQIVMAGNNSTLVAGRYEIRGILAERGPYVTYKVRDSILKREASMRTFRDIPDPAAAERFARECDILTSVNHPSVVDVFDRGELDEENGKKPFLIVAQVPGLTLDHLIAAESSRLTPVRVAEFMNLVCRGVQGAHDLGFAESGIEISDILLMKDDSVKILRFAADVGATPADVVFRLGSICYEALTFRTAERSMAQRLTSAKGGDDGLSSVIRRAIDSDPEKRFATVREFGDALIGAVHGTSASGSDTENVMETSEIRSLPQAPSSSQKPEGEFTRMFKSREVKASQKAMDSASSPTGEFTRIFKLVPTVTPPADVPPSKTTTPVSVETKPPVSADKKFNEISKDGVASGIFSVGSSGSNPNPAPPRVPELFASAKVQWQDPAPQKESSEYSKIMKAPEFQASSSSQRGPDSGTGIFDDKGSRSHRSVPENDTEYSRIVNSNTSPPKAAAPPQKSRRLTRQQQKGLLIVAIAALGIAAIMLFFWAVTSS